MLLLLRQEWRLLRVSKPYRVTLLILGLLTALAFQIGWSRAKQTAERAQRYRVEQAELHLLVNESVGRGGQPELRRSMMEDPPVDLEQLFGRPLNDIERGRIRKDWNFAKGRNSITYLPWQTWKSPSPLAALSVGESDHWADNYALSPIQDSRTLLSPRLSNPFHQLIGPLDLSTLLTIVLPLVMIVLLHDVVSSDQEQGTLRMILSQNVSFVKLAATRLAIRLSGIVLTVLAIVLTGFLLTGTDLSDQGTLRMLGVFSLSIVVYALFWAAAAWMINSAGLSSVTNAVLLTLCWGLLVIVIPLGCAESVARAHPMSSLDSLVAKEREVRKSIREERNRKRAEAQSAAGKEGENLQRQNMLNEEVKAIDRQRATMSAQIDQALKAQRSRIVAMQSCEKWSPAVALKSVCDAVSGNSLSQFLEFSRQTNDFQMELKSYFRLPPSTSQWVLTMDDVEKMPVFRPAPAGRNISWGRLRTNVMTLAVWSVVPMLIGWVGLRIRFS